MKFWLVTILSITFGALILASPHHIELRSLLGAKECTYGPTHWCQNLTNAKTCNAVKHCIQTVWEKQTVPEDNDSVCQICLDMVKQARDQLESNETQDDLRAVFEGSCKLMYVKPIVHECIKLVDDFIPELIDALSSQMNPQVVCSVAGLCNNARIDEMLAAAGPQNQEGKEFSCGKCSSISSQITSKFHSTSRDTILENMLEMCSHTSSFSDACSSILLTYFNEIYAHLNDYLTPDSLCHLSGACAGKFHQHPEDEIEIRPMSNVGFVDVQGDDIPCELCEQLVNHLRDLLTANTTESEFQQVLEGLCGQTKGFKDECMSIVEEYYKEIYEFLTKNLDSNAACFYIGVCPKGDTRKGQISPLVPFDMEAPKPSKKVLGADEPHFSSDEIMSFQLPLERLMVGKPIDREMGAKNKEQLENGGSWCTMCEYALHFIQETIADPKNEEQLKDSIMKTCKKMPQYLRAECDNFVELYGDALLALLVQEVDPSQVCPALKLCPQLGQDIEVFAPSTINVQIHSEAMSKKNSCPLCLLAVEQAQQVIQDDKTEEKVKDTLKGLCSHLKNKKLSLECSDFVDTYSKELLEMLMKDFTPQQICVYLKLCTNSGPDTSVLGFKVTAKNERDQEIETNQIDDNTIDGILISSNANREVIADTPECLLCKEIVKEVEKRVVDKKSKEEIKNALEHACDKVPRKVQKTCHSYIDQHGDRIAELIEQELAPKEVCRDIELCFDDSEEVENDGDLDIDDAVQVTVFTSPVKTAAPQTCILCEMIVARIDKDLEKPATQDEVKAYLDKVCLLVPKSSRKNCDNFIQQYAQLIIESFDHVSPKELCTVIQACTTGLRLSGDDNELIDCAVCEGCAASLEVLLKDKDVDQKIETVLEKSCHAVPARFFERCTNMVSVYGISMIEQLKRYPESHNVCAEIGMCFRDSSDEGFVRMDKTKQMSSKESSESRESVEEEVIAPRKASLVGDNECTWGPSHWCQNEELAKKCGSLDYCQKKSLGKWRA